VDVDLDAVVNRTTERVGKSVFRQLERQQMEAGRLGNKRGPMAWARYGRRRLAWSLADPRS
jgi:hypothetical protein